MNRASAIPERQGQTRLMSLVESVANVIVGYGVAVVTQILIFPVFGLHTTLAQNLLMGAIFSLVILDGDGRTFSQLRTERMGNKNATASIPALSPSE